MQSFPAGSGKFQVSTYSGIQPQWRRDGKELFYIAADGKLIAVDVTTAPQFEAEAPEALFDARNVGAGSNQFFRYDVGADGKRFLIVAATTVTEGSIAAPITVVVNWTAGSKH